MNAVFQVICKVIHSITFLQKTICIGETGDWKYHLNPEMSARIDKWTEENLKDSDLKFFTELKPLG